MQLLGGKGQCLDDFVENVGRFQSGEPLIIAHGCGGDVVTTEGVKRPPAQEKQTKLPSKPKKEALQARRNKQQQGKKSRVPAPPKSANRKSPPPSARTADNAQKQQRPQASKSLSTDVPLSAEATAQTKLEFVVPKSHPKRGKASKVCGCFGTRHKPLTNCLYCGRISCVVEGYGFCPFCGYMVEEIKGT